MLITKQLFFCDIIFVACDGLCDKAWGISCRPSIPLSDSDDDFEYLSDDELSNAPKLLETSECGHEKPTNAKDVDFTHNKWCVRECERSAISTFQKDIKIPDFSKRVKNISQNCDQ